MLVGDAPTGFAWSVPQRKKEKFLKLPFFVLPGKLLRRICAFMRIPTKWFPKVVEKGR